MRAEGKAQPVQIGDLLSEERIFNMVQASDKRSLLKAMAKDAAKTLGLDAAEVENALIGREKLGSTGLGHGIAIPHARISGLSGVFCALYRLAKPIQFDAIDDMPVDVAALLLIPQVDQRAGIQALSCIARTLKTPGLLAGIRAHRGSLADLVLANPDKPRQG